MESQNTVRKALYFRKAGTRMLAELLGMIFSGEPASCIKAKKVVAEAKQLKYRKFKGYHHRINSYRKMYWRLSKTLDNLTYFPCSEMDAKYIDIARDDVYDEMTFIEKKLARWEPKGPEAHRIRKREQKT